MKVDQSVVSAWIAGTKLPPPPHRRTLQKRYGIDPGAWDTSGLRPTAPATPVPSAVTSPRGGSTPAPGGGKGAPHRVLVGDDPFSTTSALQREIQAQFDALTLEVDAAPSEKATITQKLASALATLAKLKAQDMGKHLLATPQWRALETELFAALEPYPEAAEAVAARLEAFDAASRDAGG
jgi:hypothetical protein